MSTTDKQYASHGSTLQFDCTQTVVPVTFTPVNYTVIFTETGLPSNTPWSVLFNGNTLSSASSTITLALQNGTTHTSTTPYINFTETNGTYYISATAPDCASSTVYNTITISGSSTTFTLQFSKSSAAPSSSAATSMTEGIGIGVVIGAIAGALAGVFVASAISNRKREQK